MERQVSIVNGQQIHDVAVQPGTTAADVLRAIGVPVSHWLSARDGKPFETDETIYDLIREGDKLFTSAPANVAFSGAAR